MKNKIFSFGCLCLVLALGLVFVGCNDVQKTEFARLSAPKNVKWEAGVLTWDAVKGADSYSLVSIQDGKKNYFVMYSGVGDFVVNSNGTVDTDKYEATGFTLANIAAGINSDPEYSGKIFTFKLGIIASTSNRMDINDSNPTYVSQKFVYDGSDVTVQ